MKNPVFYLLNRKKNIFFIEVMLVTFKKIFFFRKNRKQRAIKILVVIGMYRVIG